MSWVTSAAVFQGLITCPCKVPVQAPASPQTCPVALWIYPPAAMAQWVVTITPSLLHRACQLRAKWTWPRGSPWETMGLGQTWTCSQLQVKRLIWWFFSWSCWFPVPYYTVSQWLAAHCSLAFNKPYTVCSGFLPSTLWEITLCRCTTGPMMHQQPPSQQYTMPPGGAGQHYQGQQNPMGMMGQVNQGNHVMGQRPMPPYRPPQQGIPVRVCLLSVQVVSVGLSSL